ncbi:hypothetical protein Bbelb_200600 [Branchiostoma belcheri]|nr:hypothetical protein Bbelb_200600 [Branchiostoma belcheri]
MPYGMPPSHAKGYMPGSQGVVGGNAEFSALLFCVLPSKYPERRSEACWDLLGGHSLPEWRMSFDASATYGYRNDRTDVHQGSGQAAAVGTVLQEEDASPRPPSPNPTVFLSRPVVKRRH